MSLEQAIASARSSATADSPCTVAPADALSPREREVAVLVAQGQSNRQIAAAPVITERTAGTHIGHILNKLGMHTRAQIAAWVVAHAPATTRADTESGYVVHPMAGRQAGARLAPLPSPAMRAQTIGGDVMPLDKADLAERSRSSLAIGWALLRQLETVNPPFDEVSLLGPLDELLLILANLEGDANLFSQVHPQLDVRSTAEGVLRLAQQLRLGLLQNTRFYAALGGLDRASLPGPAWRSATLVRQDMRRGGGAERDPAQSHPVSERRAGGD